MGDAIHNLGTYPTFRVYILQGTQAANNPDPEATFSAYQFNVTEPTQIIRDVLKKDMSHKVASLFVSLLIYNDEATLNFFSSDGPIAVNVDKPWGDLDADIKKKIIKYGLVGVNINKYYNCFRDYTPPS